MATNAFDPRQHPHRRYNPLTGEWILVSPHRSSRPWLGQTEAAASEARPPHDPGCYLCPGNVRANGEANPDYRGPYVFRNDFPAMTPSGATGSIDGGVFRAQPVRGECRVVCFSPRHDLSLAEMGLADVEAVIETLISQVQELGSRYAWVQLFENKGESMGCSNPHPHGQIWASDAVPTLVERESSFQAAHFARSGTPLLVETVEAELRSGERTVAENAHWILFVPFWAVWPFETLLVPRRHVSRLADLDGAERQSLAAILTDGLSRYDALFATSFPYSMGWHEAPHDGRPSEHWQLHAHAYPPLLRSASVRKFMVGYEMLAEAQRDLTPEQAAERLRAVGPKSS